MTKEREAVARAMFDAMVADKRILMMGFEADQAFNSAADAAIAAMKPLLMDVTLEMIEAGIDERSASGLFIAMLNASPLFKEPANNG